jgi:hypothetical protein
MEHFQKIVSDLTSWYWWFAVVLVGLVLNIFSSYLKTYIDRFMGKIFSERAKKRKVIFEKQFNAAAVFSENPSLIPVAIQRENRYWQLSLISFMCAILLFGFLGLIEGGKIVPAMGQTFAKSFFSISGGLFVVLCFGLIKAALESADIVELTMIQVETRSQRERIG